MASVFLSYSREDASKAEAIASALEARGHSVWWDRRLQGGSRFSQEIEQALKNSDVVLVCWSRSSVQSGWVQDEAAEGRDTGRLVPVGLDDTKPPLGFRQYQAIDMSDWKGGGRKGPIDSVHRAILAKAGSGQLVEIAPKARRARSHFRAGIAVTALLVIAAAALIYWLARPANGSDAEALRLQIGEMKALTSDVPQAVPETLREELLTALATDAVIATSSEKPRAGLEPGYALSASIRTAGEMLRFTVHVVNEGTGGIVWTDTLDRPASITGIAPRQVAVAVSQVLRCGLGGIARYGKPMPDETLSIYMNFCQEYWADTAGNDVNQGRAVDLARRLTEAAPDFSRGWSALAEVATWGGGGNKLQDPKAAHVEAVRAAERALNLDEQNSEAYQALAGLQPPFAFTAREKLHRQSISVRPSDCGCEYVGYGSFLNRVGRNSEAADAYRRAHDMIPLSAEVNTRWAEGLFLAGRPNESRKIVRDVMEIWPSYSFLRAILLRNALWTKQYGEAAKLLDDKYMLLSGAERESLRLAVHALTSGSAGAKASAIKALQEEGQSGTENASLMVTALGALGGDREALSLAARLIQQNGPRDLAALFDPSLSRARRLPQFAQIAQRFGLIHYWRESRHLPDFCKEASAPSLCADL